MRRAVLALISLLALAGPTAAVASSGHPRPVISAPAHRSGPSRAPARIALNPIAGVVQAGQYVEGANVAALHAAAYLIDVRTVYRTVAAVPRRTSSAPQSAPIVTSGPVSSLSCGPLIDGLLAQYFGNDYAWAERIVHRESSCTPGAHNNGGCDSSGRTNSHAEGLFQMCFPMHMASFVAAGCSDPHGAECGIAAARKLYDADGRGPWGG